MPTPPWTADVPPVSETPAHGEPSPADVRIWFARLEAKLDVALAQHGAKIEEHGRQIGELQAHVSRLDDRPVATVEGLLDHEQRIRELAARPYVAPRHLWAALGASAAAIAAVSPFLDRLYT